MQPEPITVEIWKQLPEEFCRQVEVVGGQVVRCESSSRLHQKVTRQLANMFEQATVRPTVREGEARDKRITGPRFSRTEYWVYAAPRRFYAATGMSVGRDGTLAAEDLTLAARNAQLNMIDYLGERGWSGQQAYAICSVAVDLKISQVVDVPSFLVSAVLPLDIFTT